MSQSKTSVQRAAGLVLLALSVAALTWALWPAPRPVETAQVTQGHFERSVQEDGKTRLRERYVISAPVAGHLRRITLKQGDAVLAHAVLATLRPVQSALLDERSRAEQVATVAALQAGVLRAQTSVTQAQSTLALARTELQRSADLLAQGFIAPTRHDAQRLAVDQQGQELARAQQDEIAARYTLERARVALRSPSGTNPGTNTLTLRAPTAGQVLSVLQTSEGMVPAGTPLLAVGDPRELEVVVDVLTQDAAQINVGTPVELAHWGGDAVLKGQVRRIEPAAFTKVSALGVEEQRVNIVVDFVSPPALWRGLGDGFKVDVRILTQTQENAVQVPVSALFPVGAHSAVLVLEQGHARQRTVAVAARNGASAWVSSGIDVGATVIVYPDTQLKDGDRVAPR